MRADQCSRSLGFRGVVIVIALYILEYPEATFGTARHLTLHWRGVKQLPPARSSDPGPASVGLSLRDLGSSPHYSAPLRYRSLEAGSTEVFPKQQTQI
jgi:hypothetical protein